MNTQISDEQFRLAYGPGLPHFGLPEGCPCTCCAEAANRWLHDREGRQGCSCVEREAERCECRFCQEMWPMSDAVNPELSGSLTIAVVGSREYPNMDLVQHFIRMLPPHVDIISGAARGVDSVAAATAREAGLDVTEFPADWDRWGKSAGFIRNNDLVASADFVVAFWDGKSRGTDHTINLAKKEQVPHFVFGPEADDIKDALRLCMEEASRRAYVR